MTAHNELFGWIHSLRINDYNIIMAPPAHMETPYPPIIEQPTGRQIIKNWNIADTGLVIFATAAFSVYVFWGDYQARIHSYYSRRSSFIFNSRMALVAALILGFRNSCYRLQGLVPNGLPANNVYEPVKYDYTT